MKNEIYEIESTQEVEMNIDDDSIQDVTTDVNDNQEDVVVEENAIKKEIVQ